VSVRVNLLPRETYARQLASRQRAFAAVAGLLLIVLLAGVYWWQASRVADARDELAAEEERVSELNAEVAALVEFEELRDRQETSDETIRTTLDGEATFAGILQDLAAVMPADSQLDSLTVSVGEASMDDTTRRPTVGSFSATGQTLASHAPGVERLLLSLEKVASFVDLFVNSSTLADDEQDIASFSVEGQIGPEVLTGRYEDGLPEALR
jgi:Tfp pilus assembly protein PilN